MTFFSAQLVLPKYFRISYRFVSFFVANIIGSCLNCPVFLKMSLCQLKQTYGYGGILFSMFKKWVSRLFLSGSLLSLVAGSSVFVF